MYVHVDIRVVLTCQLILSLLFYPTDRVANRAFYTCEEAAWAYELLFGFYERLEIR